MAMKIVGQDCCLLFVKRYAFLFDLSRICRINHPLHMQACLRLGVSVIKASLDLPSAMITYAWYFLKLWVSGATSQSQN